MSVRFGKNFTCVRGFSCETVGRAPHVRFRCLLPGTSTVMTLTLGLKPACVGPTAQLSPIKHTGIYQANFQTL